MPKSKPKVSIDHSAFEALMMNCTNNPLADADIPAMLKKVIEAGGSVVLTGAGQPAELSLEKGEFVVKYRENRQ